MAKVVLLDWRLGTQAQFDMARPLGDIETPICRASPAVGPWSRTLNASSPRQYNDFTIAEQARFKRLTNTEKLQRALIAAFASAPGQMRDKAVEALSPANLAIMAGALAIWIGAHATPIGWVVDIGMLGLGVVALGAEAAQVISEIRHFALGVINAKSEADLHKAGAHLGKAMQAAKETASTGAIARRASDGATLHQSTVDGVRIEVIKVGDKVTSAYPCGQGCTDPSTFGGL